MVDTDVVAVRAAIEREIREWSDQFDTFSQDLERRRIAVAELTDLIGGLDRLSEGDR